MRLELSLIVGAVAEGKIYKDYKLVSMHDERGGRSRGDSHNATMRWVVLLLAVVAVSAVDDDSWEDANVRAQKAEEGEPLPQPLPLPRGRRRRHCRPRLADG